MIYFILYVCQAAACLLTNYLMSSIPDRDTQHGSDVEPRRLICLLNRGINVSLCSCMSWGLYCDEAKRGERTSVSKRGSWHTSLMLTGRPVEATSSAMLLLISQSEHDSFSMLVGGRGEGGGTVVNAG